MRARILAAVAVLALQSAASAQTPQHIAVARSGDSVSVRVPLTPGASAVVSEPFLLRDRARLHLTLDGPMPEALKIDSVAGTGLMSVAPRAAGSDWQLVIEAPDFTRYRVQVDSTSAVLWLATRPATRRAVPLPLPVADPLAGEPGTATSTAATREKLAAAIHTANDLLRARQAQISAHRWTLLTVSGAVLLVGTLAVAMRRWRSGPRTAAAAEPTEPAQAKPTAPTKADPRLWAAATLASEGAEVFDVARRTGLARDVARLIVRSARRNVPAPAALAARTPTAAAARAVPAGGSTYWFTEN